MNLSDTGETVIDERLAYSCPKCGKARYDALPKNQWQCQCPDDNYDWYCSDEGQASLDGLTPAPDSRFIVNSATLVPPHNE